ncbi:hypothetical protein ZIOFF_039264 [Zingiber officinale]|uniref:Uncharacterized protein n=1 Tax=Zingiber officinale TaxID=94328 RepID=A0A8J5G478_ZINOF|nr:hypothetical protein ZIOFF_039264 [Zingiber officinale]
MAVVAEVGSIDQRGKVLFLLLFPSYSPVIADIFVCFWYYILPVAYYVEALDSELHVILFSMLFISLPLWDDTMGNQTPLRGFGDFDLDELDFGDEVEKGVEEANEASRVKRRRVLNFFSDDDGATAVNEHLSSEVVCSKTVSSDR